MKRFLINMTLFVGILLLADSLVGFCMDWLAKRAVSGQALKNHEVVDVITPDILILGSSRSTHHYVPSIIESVTGQDVYIAGQDGNGIIMMWPIMRLISDRQKPRMVIYDIIASFDAFTDEPHKYLKYLRPNWRRNSAVDSLISQIDLLEPLKLTSQSYRYNGMFPSIIKGLHMGEVYVDGFSPLYGTFADGNEANTSTNSDQIMQLKMDFFNSMMQYAEQNNIQMFFVISPSYQPTAVKEQIVPLVTLINEHGFELIDFSNDSTFIHHQELFKDPDHLNIQGAEKFTKALLQQIYP